jgi:hypothetical protein
MVKVNSDLEDTSQVIVKRSLPTTINSNGFIVEPNVSFNETQEPWYKWFLDLFKFTVFCLMFTVVIAFLAGVCYSLLKLLFNSLFT